tara:strand:+ start:3908 stop:5713 length:1806 start_codon:yes stop_codon:yes gene_type:complete
MAQTLRIKRSTTAAAPGSNLDVGELAYSSNSDKLFIGNPDGTGNVVIGGELYINMLDQTAGTLTPSSAVLVDGNSKIDQLKTANITIGANNITSGAGDIDLVAAGNLDIDAGTIDLDTQATEFKIKDNEANAIVFKEGSNKYLSLVTTNSGEKVVLDKPVTFGLDGTTGFTFPVVDGTNHQALLTNGSDDVTWRTVSTTGNITGDSGTTSVSGAGHDFSFAGTDAIDTAATTNTLTISIKDATTTQKGAASFPAADFTVSGGAVSIKDATTTHKGVASFDSTDFTVSSGAVAVNATTIGSTAVNPGTTTTAFAGLTQLDFANLRLTGTTLSTQASNVNIFLSPHGTGVVEVPSNYKDRANFSGNANALVTKGYVDAVKQALDIKESVHVATTANLAYTYDNGAGTLTAGGVGAVSLDGQALSSTGLRVLVKDQTSKLQNGIYTVTTCGDGSNALILTRATDANIALELTGGTFVFVEKGTIGGDNGFVFTHDGTPTLGTTALDVSQFSGAGQVITGNGLTKTGNELTIGSSPTILSGASSIGLRGISATAIGDVLIGAASDGGFTALAKPSGDATASDYLLSMNTSGAASWANIIDGGTFS